ncbi:hypothetical protein [Morganella morganii]|uniref:hypothetical protein n=1 Tax=Morganella morganii TaxID=582 RepID=UPI000C7C2911|nr:hypothetical protein [Morganella morganii]PLA33750.1 hypothetical protein CYJ97_04020 [Morganella morganii]QPJ70497.1 hypothetical protein IR188_09045 [Morganella morganii]
MSKSGRNYTKEKIRQRHIANKKRKHPIRLFIKSWDFWGKSCLGLFVFGMFIYSLNDNVTIHFLWIIYACICLPLFPFAKKCSDDVLRHYFSESTFEDVINGSSPRGMQRW